MKHTIFRCPGKLMLFGEHVVLEGAPALTTTLDMEFIAQWTIQDEFFDLFLGAPHRESVLGILDLLWKKVGFTKHLSGCVSMASTIPIGQGFGSSATLCTAFAYLVRNVRENPSPTSSLMLPTVRPQDLSEEVRMAVWSLANEAEQLIHGKASGVDTGAVLHPGLTSFTPRGIFPPQAKSLAPLGAWLVFGNVPRTENAKSCISKVQSQKSASSFAELVRIANDAAFLLENKKGRGRIAALACLANKAMDCFRRLGIASDAMEKVHALAMSHGSLGGKMCGAGAGGAFWFLADSVKKAIHLRNALLSHPQCSFVDIKQI